MSCFFFMINKQNHFHFPIYYLAFQPSMKPNNIYEMSDHMLNEKVRKMLLCKSVFCFLTDKYLNWVSFKIMFLDK